MGKNGSVFLKSRKRAEPVIESRKNVLEKLLFPVEWYQNARAYVGRSALPVSNAEGALSLAGFCCSVTVCGCWMRLLFQNSIQLLFPVDCCF